MPDSESLKVEIPGKRTFFSSYNGLLKLRGDDLILEEISKSDPPHTWRLPLTRIKNTEFKKKFLGGQFVFTSVSREFFKDLPGSDGISFVLNIKKAHLSRAEQFFKALKLRHVEIIGRGLQDEPTEY